RRDQARSRHARHHRKRVCRAAHGHTRRTRPRDRVGSRCAARGRGRRARRADDVSDAQHDGHDRRLRLHRRHTRRLWLPGGRGRRRTHPRRDREPDRRVPGTGTRDVDRVRAAAARAVCQARRAVRTRERAEGLAGRHVSRNAIALAVILVAALVPLVLQLIGPRQVYWLFVVSEFFIFAIVAISLDLLMGRSGQISLGHSGFVALGAYAAAILNERFGIDLLGGALCGGALAALASLLLGFPAARLRGHYLGIVTLGFGIAVDQVALKWDALTGGDQGVHLHRPMLLGLDVGSPVRIYYVALVALVVAALLVWSLTRTRVGRAFAAAAMGVAVARAKVLAFMCSAFLAGAAGGIYAFLAGFVAPEDFGIDSSLLFFAMVIIGGMGSIPGAIGGAVVVDAIKNAAATVSGLSLALLGGMIVLVVLFFPGGLKALLRARAAKRLPLDRPRNATVSLDA